MERIGEPRNRRSHATRAAVLDATWQLLEEGGAEQTTMGAVAERARVSRRALYLHFASRAELLFALHQHVDAELDLAASVEPVFAAPDAVTALDEFAAHLGRYHPRILAIDLALLRLRDDPDVAVLVEKSMETWHDGCRDIAKRLANEDRLAGPWTVDTAADLMWSFMFPETLERLTVNCGWSTERYGKLLGVILRRTLVAN